MDVNRLYAIGSVKEDFLGYVAAKNGPHLTIAEILTGCLVFYKRFQHNNRLSTFHFLPFINFPAFFFSRDLQTQKTTYNTSIESRVPQKEAAKEPTAGKKKKKRKNS